MATNEICTVGRKVVVDNNYGKYYELVANMTEFLGLSKASVVAARTKNEEA